MKAVFVQLINLELHGVIVIESVRRVNHLTCHKLTLSSRIFCLA